MLARRRGVGLCASFRETVPSPELFTQPARSARARAAAGADADRRCGLVRAKLVDALAHWRRFALVARDRDVEADHNAGRPELCRV
jgi:hypothetical protein